MSNKWIDIKKQEPGNCARILAFVGNSLGEGFPIVTGNVNLNYETNKKEFWVYVFDPESGADYSTEETLDIITHWMPIPEFPKEYFDEGAHMCVDEWSFSRPPMSIKERSPNYKGYDGK